MHNTKAAGCQWQVLTSYLVCMCVHICMYMSFHGKSVSSFLLLHQDHLLCGMK